MRSSTRASLLIACGLALRLNPAAGQVPPTPFAEPATPADTHWYGWETLTTDGAAVGLFALGMEMDANRNLAAFSAVMLSLGTFALGGPIIHAAHGSWPKAGYSFVLRFVFMSIGAAVGANTDCDYAYDHEGCWVLHAIYGLAVGGAVAGLVDAAVIGHEHVVRPTGSAPIVGFMPLRGGGGLSLVGRF